MKFSIAGLLLVLVLLAPNKTFGAGATLSLSPVTKSVAVGETFNVSVILDTGGQAVSSVAAVINYDPLLVSPVIIPGTDLVMTKSTVASGLITLGTGTLTPNYTGSTTLAIINFKALKAGTAQATIIFTGAATGSSVVTGANGTTNILSLVNSGVYTISGGAAVVPVPTTGAVENTLMIFGTGLLFLIMSGAGLLWNLKR